MPYSCTHVATVGAIGLMCTIQMYYQPTGRELSGIDVCVIFVRRQVCIVFAWKF